jgi:RHS repeat-associated protein
MPPSTRQSFVVPWKVGEGKWTSFFGTNMFKGISYVKRGYKTYELSNHLGNVLATVSDRRVCGTCTDSIVDFYDADILTISDDYPFGMTMQGRTQYAEKYRFGFNGMEKYDHWQGDGHAYDFGARVYDSRLGRWMSVDALFKMLPSFVPYAFVGNCPISHMAHIPPAA